LSGSQLLDPGLVGFPARDGRSQACRVPSSWIPGLSGSQLGMVGPRLVGFPAPGSRACRVPSSGWSAGIVPGLVTLRCRAPSRGSFPQNPNDPPPEDFPKKPHGSFLGSQLSLVPGLSGSQLLDPGLVGFPAP
jgi:hypothetical protein